VIFNDNPSNNPIQSEFEKVDPFNIFYLLAKPKSLWLLFSDKLFSYSIRENKNTYACYLPQTAHLLSTEPAAEVCDASKVS
jgi:hypothetical protein